MQHKFPHLRAAIERAKVIELPQPGSKTYKFRTFAFGERGTMVDHNLVEEVSDGLCASIRENFEDFDYIVAPEPGGHTWGILVASKLGKSINILRSQPSYEESETEVQRKTGYYQQNLYFNHFQSGDKVLVIDDVVSTGGTLDTILETFGSIGVIPIGVQVIYAKSDDYKKLEQKHSIPIRFLEK